jgi:hypothetical protein
MIDSESGLHLRRETSGGIVILQHVRLAGFGLFLTKGLFWLAVPATLHRVLTA